MKIAVNTRCLFPASTNQVSRFTDGLLKSLTTNYPQEEFYFFSDQPFPLQFGLSKNITPIQIKSFFRDSFLGHWWYWVRLPKVLKKIKADVFLSTDGLTVFKMEIRRVTFMPIIAEASGNESIGRGYLRTLLAKSAQVSEKVVVCSPEYGQILRQKYAFAEKKIIVVPLAANHYFKRINFALQVLVRKKYAAGEGYFLLPELPASPENLNLLIAGFSLLKERTHNDLKLIIAGKKSKQGLLPGKKNNLKFKAEDLIFTGPVTAQTLAVLYAAAVATIYFPVEGSLNLPVLEAQQSGSPLITVPSPETDKLAGNGALYINNLSAEDIFATMAQVYHNTEFRTKLVTEGLENAKRFTWLASSQKFMQLLETTVQAKNIASATV